MQNVDISAMDIDDTTPRKKDDLLAMAVVQDLDPFSVTELRERIVLLEAEIDRVKRKIEGAVHHRESANSLFKGG